LSTFAVNLRAHLGGARIVVLGAKHHYPAGVALRKFNRGLELRDAVRGRRLETEVKDKIDLGCLRVLGLGRSPTRGRCVGPHLRQALRDRANRHVQAGKRIKDFRHGG